MPRRPHDMYETPPHYVRALLRHIQVAPFASIYEPCVGQRAIVDEIRRVLPHTQFTTNDIDSSQPADTHDDATTDAAWTFVPTLRNADWVITNPPFSLEYPILKLALESHERVAFLARLSFLEPTEERRSLLEINPPHKIIVLPRYSFRANDAGKRQTDSVTCCWLVWDDSGERGVFVEGARE